MYCADHVHPFMTTHYYYSSDGCFQQYKISCHKAQIISNWSLEHDNQFIVLKCPPRSPDFNPIEQLWDMVEQRIHIVDVQPASLHQLCDVIMPIWNKMSSALFWTEIAHVSPRIHPESLTQFTTLWSTSEPVWLQLYCMTLAHIRGRLG